jgi:hypothetical protein
VRVPRALEHGWLDAVPVVLLRPAFWLQQARAKELYESGAQLPGPWSSLKGWTRVREGWKRLLWASEFDRRLRSEEFVATRQDDLLTLPSLGREARVAAQTVQKLLSEGATGAPEAAMWMTQSGAADFGEELTHLMGRDPPATNQHEVVMALIGAWGRDAELHPAFTDEVIARWDVLTQRQAFETCERIAVRQDGFARQLLRRALQHENPETRTAVLAAVQQFAGLRRADDWFVEVLEPAWSRLSSSEREIAVVILAKSAGPNESWGPRLLLMCETPGAARRTECLVLINRILARVPNASATLRSWIRDLDSSDPMMERTPRQTTDWLVKQGCHIKSSGAQPFISLVRAVCGLDDQIRILLRIVRDTRDIAVARQAMAAIGSSLGPEGSASFARERMLVERDEWIRATLIDSVVKPYAGHIDLMQPIILGALDERSGAVLLNACLAAAEMGVLDPAIMARLETLTRHEDDQIARVAAAAINKLQGSAQIVEPLP